MRAQRHNAYTSRTHIQPRMSRTIVIEFEPACRVRGKRTRRKRAARRANNADETHEKRERVRWRDAKRAPDTSADDAWDVENYIANLQGDRRWVEHLYRVGRFRKAAWYPTYLDDDLCPCSDCAGASYCDVMCTCVACVDLSRERKARGC